MNKEKELDDDNKSDEFKCQACPKKTTRGEIRKIWNSIPFVNEDKKTYYCGCMGWE